MFDPESFSKLSETYQQALRPRIEIRVLRAARCYICTNFFFFILHSAHYYSIATVLLTENGRSVGRLFYATVHSLMMGQ